jgi:hypothetical protein
MNGAVAWGMFLWAGVLLGVSFIATPAKFLAPSLPLAQALDVGRSTFHVLALVEWAMLSAFLTAVNWQPPRPRVVALLLLVAAVMAVEAFALRPLLDTRVEAIMAGNDVAPSHLHRAYIVLEILKLALILTAAVFVGRQTNGT